MPDLTLSPSEWLDGFRETWSRWTDPSPHDTEPSDEQPTDNPDRRRESTSAWWYGDPPALAWPRPEPLRMAPMQPAGAAPTIDIEVYHTGLIKSARVAAVALEWSLRDAWGDRYHVDVTVHEPPLRDRDEWSADAFHGWVESRPSETAKDCNVLLPAGSGWHVAGGGDSAVAQRGSDVDDLYGETLFVRGDSAAYDELSTVQHEVLHCLGFAHGAGGLIDGHITPMGHYANDGDSYTLRLHPDVAAEEPDLADG